MTGSTDNGRPYTRAILLSAGHGRRLLPLTSERPKCLVPVAGTSILERQVSELLAAGIDEVVVVTGYGTDQVEQLLLQQFPGRPVRVAFNPFFDLSDNLASCWIARDGMDADFLLLNGDIVFERAVLDRVLGSPPAPITLTVDYKDSYDDDDMKVELNGKRVQHVSKTLAPEHTHCESIGLLYFREHGPRLFRSAVDNALRHRNSLRLWYLSIIDALAGEALVHACSIAGLKWAEIDFPQDLVHADALFGSGSDRPGAGPAPAEQDSSGP